MVTLKEHKPPERHLRKCGHPSDWSLDLMDLNGIIISYCMGCVISKLGLRPVAKHKIIKDRQYPQGHLVKIWGES